MLDMLWPGVFHALSLEAARLWTLSSAMEDGSPVTCRVSVPIDFATEGPPAAAAAGS